MPLEHRWIEPRRFGGRGDIAASHGVTADSADGRRYHRNIAFQRRTISGSKRKGRKGHPSQSSQSHRNRERATLSLRVAQHDIVQNAARSWMAGADSMSSTPR